MYGLFIIFSSRKINELSKLEKCFCTIIEQGVPDMPHTDMKGERRVIFIILLFMHVDKK